MCPKLQCLYPEDPLGAPGPASLRHLHALGHRMLAVLRARQSPLHLEHSGTEGHGFLEPTQPLTWLLTLQAAVLARPAQPHCPSPGTLSLPRSLTSQESSRAPSTACLEAGTPSQARTLVVRNRAGSAPRLPGLQVLSPAASCTDLSRWHGHLQMAGTAAYLTLASLQL